MPRLKLGILASGSGSNLQAILDAIADGRLNADPRIVIVNIPGAKALERAHNAGVKTALIAHREFPDRASFDTALTEALNRAGAEWVVLAGFMRVLTPGFIARHHRRIINIHPALLPAFPGVHAQAQALAYGAKISGCTVHFVDEGVDCGPIIAQRAVSVEDDDTVESLTARILREEHKLFVQVLQWLAADRIRWTLDSEAARPKISIEPA
jgi:phosphoribosylglycinamide formyltransferase-1